MEIRNTVLKQCALIPILVHMHYTLWCANPVNLTPLPIFQTWSNYAENPPMLGISITKGSLKGANCFLVYISLCFDKKRWYPGSSLRVFLLIKAQHVPVMNLSKSIRSFSGNFSHWRLAFQKDAVLLFQGWEGAEARGRLQLTRGERSSSFQKE